MTSLHHYSRLLDKVKTRIGVINNQKPSHDLLIGLVNMQGKLTKKLNYATLADVDYEPSDWRADIYLPEKVELILKSQKRFIIWIGGRGSGKSIGMGRITMADMFTHGISYCCLREFQKSVKDSVHSLIKSQILRVLPDDFEVFDQEIRCKNAIAVFGGIARNPDSIKSAYGFGRFWVEEAQSLSAESLKNLTPTARALDSIGLPNQEAEVNPNMASIVFTGNPSSSEDPFSKRFINPFIDKLDNNGIYEDDLHLVVEMNYCDNPWFRESGLEPERQWDKQHLDPALYEHIWEGKFNDSVQYALIFRQWFDACIDAHLKLKWPDIECHGQRKVSHDPSDTGSDAKSICRREGNIIREVTDRDDLDVNEGSDWAIGEAIQFDADVYEYDAGGMGAALKRDVNTALQGRHIEVYQFLGQSAVDDPDLIYRPSKANNIRKELKNKEICINLRSQYYLRLRDRIYRTYRAVIFGDRERIEDLISISSNCTRLRQLRSELCRMPIKPSATGRFELYSKKEMREKHKMKSPNLADCIMMTEREHRVIDNSIGDNIQTRPRLNYW